MKFVIGWLKLRPGKREEFLALAPSVSSKMPCGGGWHRVSSSSIPVPPTPIL